MPRFRTFETIASGATDSFGAYEVAEEEILQFAAAYDPQDFHIDHAAAKKSLFGGLCASGWHVAAIAMRIMVDRWREEGHSLGSPGVDELRWHKPVYPGDVLSVRITVLETRLLNSKPGIGIVKSLVEVMNGKNEVVSSMKMNAFFPQESMLPFFSDFSGS